MITIEDLESFSLESELFEISNNSTADLTLKHVLAECEKRAITTVLEEEDSNLSRVAKRLGVSYVTLWRKINRHGLTKDKIEHTDLI